ncbi:hypothetical protein M1D80_11040 [Phyllobacteriaceae bacterium JZ32]
MPQTAGETYLKAAAEEIQAANPGLSFEKAYAKALEENPRFYELHAAEFTKRSPRDFEAELERERKPTKKPKRTEEEEQIERLARKRADERGESFAKALTSVLEENPTLYEAYDVSRMASGE